MKIKSKQKKSSIHYFAGMYRAVTTSYNKKLLTPKKGKRCFAND